MGKLKDLIRKQGESLTARADEVSSAFRSQQPPTSYNFDDAWVTEVFDDHVIVCEDGDYYSIPYATQPGTDDPVFAMEQAQEVERTWQVVEKTVVFEKFDEDDQTAFGWAYVFQKDGERVIDHSGEFVEGPDLETAAYEFNIASREGDDWHTEKVQAHLIESVVITDQKLEAMGIAKDALPSRGWWTGWYFPDADTFAKVKSGERPMLSIGGVANREHVDA